MHTLYKRSDAQDDAVLLFPWQANTRRHHGAIVICIVIIMGVVYQLVTVAAFCSTQRKRVTVQLLIIPVCFVQRGPAIQRHIFQASCGSWGERRVVR